MNKSNDLDIFWKMVDKIIAQDRLTQMKSRATAQLAIIDLVRSSIPTQSTGTIWEVGYGSGRTYDRLTTLFPNAPITVFDNRPDGRERVEADGNLFLEGDAFDLLPKTAADAPGTVMFMHADIGTPNFEKDIVRVGGLGTLAQQALVEGAYIASDRPIAPNEWTLVSDGLAYNWSYFLWRR